MSGFIYEVIFFKVTILCKQLEVRELWRWMYVPSVSLRMFGEFFVLGFSCGIVYGVASCGLIECCLGGRILLYAIIVWYLVGFSIGLRKVV